MPAPGPFHSLTADDQSRLRTLLATGISVAAAARQTGCHYGHALNFAHHHQLISPSPRPTITDTVRDHFLDLVANSHHSVNSAAAAVVISPTVAYRLARQAGVHHQLTHSQRATLVTERRIEFLRLRLAGLHLADAATAVGVDVRQARDYDKGLTTSGSPRQRFLPSGGDARTYNRLMTALIERDDVIEHGRTAEPALPSGIDSYKPIHARYLNIHERALIADLILEGHTIRGIARRVGRSPSTISREIRRNHHAEGPYRPDTAQNKAAGRRLRPKTPKMLGNRRLYDYVVAGLRAQWSPEQIAYRIRRDHPDDQEMDISHETIYQAFYLAPKGRLADLGVQLPTGRKKRRLRCRARSGDTDRFVDKMVLIDHRPDEVEERILPGHWEGDLIMGAGNRSAVTTLVERVSRFTLLGHLPAGHSSTEVLAALQQMVTRLDASIWSSITWDQGAEMAGHKNFTMATTIPIFFCHPASPWERGTNENTNGRLRRNLPKSSDLSIYSAEDLEMIANIHNHKPRKALDWLTPAEVMAAALKEVGSITS